MVETAHSYKTVVLEQPAYAWPVSSSTLDHVRELLLNPLYRPLPQQLLGVDKQSIVDAAHLLSYPVRGIELFEPFQKMVFPLIKDKIGYLLQRHDPRNTTFVILGRDGELMYDAMATVLGGLHLQDKVRLVSISQIYARNLKKAYARPDSEHVLSDHVSYLAHERISEQAIRSGEHFVFVDSGFKGSIFDAIIESLTMLLGIERGSISYTGYLISRDDDNSLYEEVGWNDPTGGIQFFMRFFEKFAAGWDPSLLFGVRQIREGDPRFDARKRASWALANYMQIQPKYAGPSARAAFIDGAWRAVSAPENEWNSTYDIHIDGHITADQKPILSNQCAVDPVAALALQTMTVNHFSHVRL